MSASRCVLAITRDQRTSLRINVDAHLVFFLNCRPLSSSIPWAPAKGWTVAFTPDMSDCEIGVPARGVGQAAAWLRDVRLGGGSTNCSRVCTEHDGLRQMRRWRGMGKGRCMRQGATNERTNGRTASHDTGGPAAAAPAGTLAELGGPRV